MNTFLPDNYKVPSESNYMKFGVGTNKFRVLSSPIIGFEVWVDTPDKKRKPIRAKDLFELQNKAPLTNYKHFWAMPVWNYQENKVQILEITQKTVLKDLTALIDDEDWGSPLNYDIVVNRVGTTKDDTEYSTQPKPAKEVEKSILGAYKKSNIHLEALYEGEDPFKDVNNEVMTTKESDKVVEDAIKDIPF